VEGDAARAAIAFGDNTIVLAARDPFKLSVPA
jgi:hypothetical protein